eukprot:1370678-Amorphochlora_amoeboformis.AAC.1
MSPPGAAQTMAPAETAISSTSESTWLGADPIDESPKSLREDRQPGAMEGNAGLRTVRQRMLQLLLDITDEEIADNPQNIAQILRAHSLFSLAPKSSKKGENPDQNDAGWGYQESQRCMIPSFDAMSSQLLNSGLNA